MQCKWWWTGAHLIIALEQENVAITGLGTVNGNTGAFLIDNFNHEEWFRWRNGSYVPKNPDRPRPGQMIAFIECKHVDVRDFTVYDSHCWSLFFYGCEHVTVIGYKAFNRKNVQCTDGMDIDCCRYVTVSDCMVHSGDDGITIRSTGRRLKNRIFLIVCFRFVYRKIFKKYGNIFDGHYM